MLGGVVVCGMASPLLGRERGGALRTQVDAFARANAFSGVVATARRGRIDFSAVYGMADIETAVPMTLGTRFRIGSVSKRLTSVAVLRLVERGQLDLDAPVTRYLPDFPRGMGARVTLRRMLSNTSGVPDGINAALKDTPLLRTSTAGSAEMLRRYAVDGPLAFEPGTQFDYNVINWVIVHAVIERVTGMPFARALETLVFAPLGMRDAVLVDTVTSSVPHLAAAYNADGKRRMDPVPPFAGASGNVCLTAADAARAAHGIYSTGLLSARSRTALMTIEFAPEDYALGGRVRMMAGRRWSWDTGKVQGYRTMLSHDLAGDRTIVILNSTDMDQGVIAKQTQAMAAIL
jgi:D-alanyl-D-alanine carboxypeptidase